LWYPATIVEAIRRDRWEVAYDSWGSDWNRLVGPESLRPRQAAEQVAAPDPPGRPVGSAAELREGSAVLILYGGTWYPGRVRHTTQEGTVRVGYDGYGDNWDETVELARLRHPS
jgi:hypothetical protein